MDLTLKRKSNWMLQQGEQTVCVVCSLYCCIYGHPTRIKDGDSNTTQDGQPTGSHFVHKHTFVA